jgi:hypothetical protein
MLACHQANAQDGFTIPQVLGRQAENQGIAFQKVVPDGGKVLAVRPRLIASCEK